MEPAGTQVSHSESSGIPRFPQAGQFQVCMAVSSCGLRRRHTLAVAELEASDSRDAAAARGLLLLFVSASESAPAEEEAGGSGVGREVGSSIGELWWSG